MALATDDERRRSLPGGTSTKRRRRGTGASDTRPAYRLCVGVDIAAATATVAWRSLRGPVSRPITIEQTPQGFAVLQERRRATDPVWGPQSPAVPPVWVAEIMVGDV